MSTRCAAARPAVQDSAKEMVHPFAVRMSTIRAARVSVSSCLITYSIKMLLLAINAYPGDIFYTPCRFTGIEKWMFTRPAALRWIEKWTRRAKCQYSKNGYGDLRAGQGSPPPVLLLME